MKYTMHRVDKDEVPGVAVGMLVKGLGGIVGAELKEFLRASNLPDAGFEKGRAIPSVSRGKFTPVYRSCVGMIRERVQAVYGSSHLSFDCADLLCACVLSCKRLDEAINRTAKFVEVLNGRGMKLSLEVREKQAILKIDAQRKGKSPEELVCNFLEICFYHKLFSWLIAEPLADGAIELDQPPWESTRALEEMMGAPINFEKPVSAIVFKREMLKRPVVKTARDLEEMLRGAPIELMPVPPAKKLSVILTGIFRRSLEEKVHIPQVDEVAYQLGQSGPTLRRHLAKENTSFQELVDKCRMEKARELLKDSNLTIDDISYHLGFSAPSGFSRAFKDWTGCAPSIYRQRQNDVDDDRMAVGFR